MTVPTIACILTHNRPEMLKSLMKQLDLQMHPEQDGPILILDNASDPPVSRGTFARWLNQAFEIIRIPDQPPNLAYNMNQGFIRAQGLAMLWRWKQWNVAMLCDDIDLPHGWLTAVAGTLRDYEAVAASTHTIRPLEIPLLKRQPDSDIMNRMQGSAFVLAGEKVLRADENLKWWWQDTDLDFTARIAGGMVLAAGPVAQNTRPNEFTYSYPGMGEQAGRDREWFGEKWGGCPW